MRIWRSAGKAAFKIGKGVLENPETRAKIVSTGQKAWRHPTVQSKRASLLNRLKGKAGDKPDKNQTKMF